MAHNAKAVALLHAFVWLLSGSFTISNGEESDISCLKSIKDSLEDPFDSLSSWNFNNKTAGFICKYAGVDCWQSDENRVLNIRLSDMGLKGEFPRGIANCTSLTGIDLSQNHLYGTIPSDLSKLIPYMTSLDLSFNDFFGKIPVSIANCSHLNVLKLDNNQLTGHIPEELGLLRRLKTFSVANNQLSGPVPKFPFASFPMGSYANNTGLCGYDSHPCSNSKKDYHIFFVSGFVVGWVVFTIWVFVVTWSFMPCMCAKGVLTLWHLNRRPIHRLKAQERIKNIKISMLEKLVTRMSFTELSKATNNFNEDNVIGMGKKGPLYKARLPNGWFLAIKRLHDSQQYEEQFVAEIMTLGRLRHNNLVPLIGFCIESEENILVYKYMSNGNLYDWLHTMEGEAKFIDWPLRVKIAVGVARGLAWLHHNSNFLVLHHNISSNSVLLDQNFEPKISNFWEAKFLNPNSAGSSRSFLVNGALWEWDFNKEDVYSFGIVLLELVTGEEPSQMINSFISSDGILAERITHLLSSSSGLYEVVDKSLHRQGLDGEIFQFLTIACTCIQPIPDQRPTMLDVYKALRAIGEPYGLTNDSEIAMQNEIVAANDRDGYIDV